MLFHIGNNFSVSDKDLISIMDLENITIMKDSREFLKMCEEEEFTQVVAPGEMPKSVILTEENGQTRVYLSPISVATLRKRVAEII